MSTRCNSMLLRLRKAMLIRLLSMVGLKATPLHP
ncbi:Uncharacterised protein [Bordetella pertussis]|nr:Uncharacterised protein [Bordetella pertussis]